MFSQWKFCFLAFVALAVLGSCQDEALEHTHGETSPILMPEELLAEMHKKMDASKDGNVSLSEMLEFAHIIRTIAANKENISELIESMDANKDGKLQLEEAVQPQVEDKPTDEEKATHERYVAEFTAYFKAADRNADGILEDKEVRYFFHPEIHDEVLQLLATAHLKRKDKDGDGKLSQHEFSEVPQELNPSDPENNEHEGGADEDFVDADKDGDGFLSVHELKAWEAGSHREEALIKEFFEAADEDQDKLLTLSEFEMQYFTKDHVELAANMEVWREHAEL